MAVVIVAKGSYFVLYMMQYCVIMCTFVTIVSSVSVHTISSAIFCSHCLYCSNVVACLHLSKLRHSKMELCSSGDQMDWKVPTGKRVKVQMKLHCQYNSRGFITIADC